MAGNDGVIARVNRLLAVLPPKDQRWPEAYLQRVELAAGTRVLTPRERVEHDSSRSTG